MDENFESVFMKIKKDSKRTWHYILKYVIIKVRKIGRQGRDFWKRLHSEYSDNSNNSTFFYESVYNFLNFQNI